MIGHPQYAKRDIVGEAVNRAFFIVGWVSKNCPSGIGATEPFMKLARQSFEVTLHADVRVELIDEDIDIYEIISPQ
jgi:hypothetical protein